MVLAEIPFPDKAGLVSSLKGMQPSERDAAVKRLLLRWHPGAAWLDVEPDLATDKWLQRFQGSIKRCDWDVILDQVSRGTSTCA